MKVFGFAGYSGSGKTTLIEQLIPRFTGNGLRVSLIKHAHHRFDIDQAGKDSWRHRHAGATEVLLSSSRRWALMHELRDQPEPTLDQLIARLSDCDLVFVEGYKSAPIPKMEIHRVALDVPRLWPDDPAIVAVACDSPIAATIPVIALDDIDRIAGFINDYLANQDAFSPAAI